MGHINITSRSNTKRFPVGELMASDFQKAKKKQNEGGSHSNFQSVFVTDVGWGAPKLGDQSAMGT